MLVSMFAFADTIKDSALKVVPTVQEVTDSVPETSSISSYFLNGIEFNFFIALFIFALLGALINLLFNILDRNKASQRTPEEFSILFLLKDNIIRFTLSILMIYFGIIFSEYLLGTTITIQIATCIGFSLDSIAEIIKNKFKIKASIAPTINGQNG